MKQDISFGNGVAYIALTYHNIMHDFVKIVTNRCVFALLYLDEKLVINNRTEISDLLNYL